MKFFSLSTTSKVYLLTLLFLIIIISINQAVFAQDSANKVQVSQERLKVMQTYLDWSEKGQYGVFKKDLGIRTAQEFKSYLSRVVSEDSTCLQSQDPDALRTCRGKIKFDYKLAKKFNRVLKYLQIEEGKPNLCVKADLGVNTSLKVMIDVPLEDGTGESIKDDATVYLCTNDSGEKILRVSYKGKLLPISEADAKREDLQMKNIPPKDAFDILVKKMGLTQPSGVISANPNPCIIPAGTSTCGEVEIEWDVSDETSDPVEVKTKDGKFVERSRNGSEDILDIGPNGQTFILYSLGRKINEITVKALQQ